MKRAAAAGSAGRGGPYHPSMPNGTCRLASFLLTLALGATVLASVGGAAGAAGEIQPQLVCNPAPVGGASDPVSGGFYAVTPVRLLDTRIALGPIDAGCTAVLDLHGFVGAEASGVALDVVTVDAQDRGFVTAYPCETDRPLASNVNPRVGDPTPNSVVAPLLASRQVCLYVSVRTELVVDLTGWFGPGGASFHGMTPERALDTRFGPRPDGGTGQLHAGETLALPLAGVGSVPPDARGVAVNLTVTNSADPGFITAYPCDVPRPFTSNGNYLAVDTRANQALIGLDGAGRLCIFTLATVDLVVDVSGWFTGTDGTRLEPVVGTRVVDSRDGTGGWSGPLRTGETQLLRSNARRQCRGGCERRARRRRDRSDRQGVPDPLSVRDGAAADVVGELRTRQRSHQFRRGRRGW